jgi:hypothetical protein
MGLDRFLGQSLTDDGRVAILPCRLDVVGGAVMSSTAPT